MSNARGGASGIARVFRERVRRPGAGEGEAAEEVREGGGAETRRGGAERARAAQARGNHRAGRELAEGEARAREGARGRRRRTLTREGVYRYKRRKASGESLIYDVHEWYDAEHTAAYRAVSRARASYTLVSSIIS